MNKTPWIVGLTVALIAVIVIAILISHGSNYGSNGYPATGTSTSTPVQTGTTGGVSTGTTNTTQSVSDGTVTFTYDTAVFGLATNPQQILTKSYIPACSDPFSYCVYYNGSAYKGTNFESAGIRIVKRPDLKTPQACLGTQPDGYQNIKAAYQTASSSDFMITEYAPLGDAGAGHFAQGSLYRLSFPNMCYEFETRIGQTQFANYPAGTVKEFTTANATDLKNLMWGVLNTIVLPSGKKPIFPPIAG